MRRRHLFEWEDQPWLPDVFRDFITDHLCYYHSFRMRQPVNQAMADHLKPLLAQANGDPIVDLCAGAGGPLLEVRRILSNDLDRPVNVVLTDLYPNEVAFRRRIAEGEGAVQARYDSVSAFDVPAELSGPRTLFTSLHHFRPDDAKRLLGDAVHKRQPIAIFEPLERKPRMLVYLTLYSLANSIALTPFVGRMTLPRFLMTYVIPLAPAIAWWDGMVSIFRSYTPDELSEMAHSIGADDYTWQSGCFEFPGPFRIPMPTTYLIGCPVDG